MRRSGTAAATAVASVFVTVTTVAGCGLADGSGAAPGPSPSPSAPYTRETAAAEIASVTEASGLRGGDTSTAGAPRGSWRACVAPWTAQAPAAYAAEAFEATVKRLRQHDWEIVSSHAERDVTFRTLVKRNWKVYARHYAPPGPDGEQTVAFTAVEDGCALPGPVRGAYTDPA
ncbi:hypothetical protein [Streptomyces griseus]|uniref:hypothetical protein n=1 Tax=Streptomyces griseus TaxID=1911 RepID=UPI0020C7D6AF|nr:hypothetical protein [Streptomyces griseus]